VAEVSGTMRRTGRPAIDNGSTGPRTLVTTRLTMRWESMNRRNSPSRTSSPKPGRSRVFDRVRGRRLAARVTSAIAPTRAARSPDAGSRSGITALALPVTCPGSR